MLDIGKHAWSRDDTMAYLKANPLPREFKWPHRDGGDRHVQPSHKSIENYGKWLRETPYFPGLFELVHDILAAAQDLGDSDWLGAELASKRAKNSEATPFF